MQMLRICIGRTEPFTQSNSHKVLYKNWDPITLRGYKLTFYRELLTFQRRFLFEK